MNISSVEKTDVVPALKNYVRTRWLVDIDMAAVLRIERESFDHLWTEADFRRERKNRTQVFRVAEINNEIVGFIGYQLNNEQIQLLTLAVGQNHRRIGVGGYMVGKLVQSLSLDKRNEVVATVRETNVRAQLFFRAMGFLACETVRDYYSDTDEDGYVMRFKIQSERQLRVAPMGSSRTAPFISSAPPFRGRFSFRC